MEINPEALSIRNLTIAGPKISTSTPLHLSQSTAAFGGVICAMAAKVPQNDTGIGGSDTKAHLEASSDHVVTIDGQDDEGGDPTSSEQQKPNGKGKKAGQPGRGGKRRQKDKRGPKYVTISLSRRSYYPNALRPVLVPPEKHI
jgi:hypothetical protein